MRTLALLMATLLLAAGLASAPVQSRGLQREMKVGFIYISRSAKKAGHMPMIKPVSS